MIYIFRTTGRFFGIESHIQNASKETGVPVTTIQAIVDGDMNSSNGFTFVNREKGMPPKEQQGYSDAIGHYFAVKTISLKRYLKANCSQL